jgi:superfamily II DNA or RNA helicase
MKTSTFENIENKIRESGDKNKFGKDFEWLCKYYLENHPIYRSLLDKVWLWNDWPDRWGRDAGIDIIAETKNGRKWAIQCKAVSPEYSIKKSEIDSFLSESNREEIDYRLLIGTTNNIGSNAHQTLKGQEKGVGLILRSDLLRDDINWPDTIGYSPKQVLHSPAEPRPHQVAAISDVITGFRKNSRGQLIMACGTGKTLAGLWIAEQLAARRILVLVPTLSLVSQTIREWSANAKTPFEYCAVCSDETVVSDEAISSTSDLGIPVTTSPEMISQFLDNAVGRGIVFCTYHSSDRIAEALSLTKERFDLSISDEAHRCTGKLESSFGTILDSDKIRCNKRLFMTATPRIFKEHIKKKAGEVDIEIASMDETEQFGPVFHRLDFSRSVKLGLLSDYQVIVIGVTDRETKKFVKEGTFVRTDDGITTDARTLAAQIGLSKAMKKYDLSKVITFHSSIAKASRFSSNKPDSFQGVVNWLPKSAKPSGNLWIRHISGKMPTSRRISLLNELKNTDDRGLITNCRCLSEGVDVPALDGISFVDPKTSQIDIIQAVGRVMRKSPGKEKGTIIVPVFVNETEDTDTALQESSYDTVWAVIRALRSHDDLLAIELDNLRTKLGSSLKLTTDKIKEKITLDLPTLVLKDFEGAFYVKSIEHSSLQWQAMIGQLKQYKKKYGHVNVPTLGKKYYQETIDSEQEPWAALGQWVHKTRFRKRQKRSRLSKDLLNQLDKLGFDWRFEGETLDNVDGLMSEKQMQLHHFNGLPTYRKKGWIKPYGWRRSAAVSVTAYYHPDQIDDIKKALIKHFRPEDPKGKWIDDPTGLLSEIQATKIQGFSQLPKYRKKGLIKPIGYCNTTSNTASKRKGALTSFYHPEQMEELKRKLIEYYYGESNPKIVEDAESKGYKSEWEIISNSNTKSKNYDPKYSFSRLGPYRRQGKIKPDCYSFSAGPRPFSPFYKLESIIKVKEDLFSKFLEGLDMRYGPLKQTKLIYDTTGLITEKEFRKKKGFTALRHLRKTGQITPYGYAIGHSTAAFPFVAYYKPEQEQEYYDEKGITIFDTENYLTEAQIRKEYYLKSITKYRKRGWIVPVGKGLVPGVSGGSLLYKPEQIPELKKTIIKEQFKDPEGIWFDDVEGLITQEDVKYNHYRSIIDYKRKGLIRPYGYGRDISREGTKDNWTKIVPYYHLKQFEELERVLGVTLTDTSGLVPQFELTSKYGISHPKIKSHLVPVGKGWFRTKRNTYTRTLKSGKKTVIAQPGMNKKLVNYYKKEDVLKLQDSLRK